MLKNLKIRKYALIDELDIEFHRGFSVITGETGAGKSIILGAIGLVLGERADTKSIKDGAEKCIVEALFDIAGAGLENFFTDNDFDYDEKECVVRRELLKSGKSRAFINDTPATLVQLRELGQKLVDIHSQHQNLLIAGSDFQMEVLDAVAGNVAEKTKYEACFSEYKRCTDELRKLKAEIARKREDEDYIRYSLQQFEAADLKENEEDELEAEQQKLAHAEEITAALAETCNAMDNDEGSVMDALSRCAGSLAKISKFLPEAESLSDRIDSACIELRDIYDELKGMAEDDDFDPARLQEVDARLSTIYDLERKYHTESYDELLKKEEELRGQLELIDDGSEMLADKEKECAGLRKDMEKAAQALSDSRRKAGNKLAKDITERLKPLGMPDVRFSVELKPLAEPSITGMDEADYLFSANKSSSLRSIGTIASGGEIARIMLCLKAIVSEVKGLPTIIFDEIDTGVSGRIAEQMALTMQQICSGGTQVICITHLPQIAARGEFHYLVYKRDEDGKTMSHIELLTGEGRLREMAKMLSGSEVTDAALDNARDLLGKGNRL